MDELAEELGAENGRLTPPVAAAIRRELLGRGYDAMIITDAVGDGVDYVIALDSVTVKAVLS